MPLPDAVRQQGELADEALEALSRSFEDTGDVTPTPEPEPGDDGAPVEGAEPEAEPTPGPEPTPEPHNEADYEQRYKTLEGKYKAEIPRLHQELAFLRGQLESAKTNPTSPEPTAEPEPQGPAFKNVLSEEEIETFGEDQLDVQSRIARGEAENLVKDLRGEVENLRRQMAESQAAELQDGFWRRAEAAFPGASEINESDPLWPDFLDRVDPVSGLTYRDLGSAAIASGDVGRLVGIMRLYKGRPSTPAPSTPETPVAKPAQVRSPNPQTAGQEKPLVKASQMQKFYDDWGRGVYKGREQKAAELDAMFEDAVAEGRIVAG